ncbi:MAG: hypothetical protein QXG22_00300 [Candidatus Hadarchaeales archaeon]
MEGEAELREKLARAAQLLFFKHHAQPGARGWELKRALGREYEQVLKVLEEEVGKLGLTIKKVSEGGEPESDRYFLTLKGHPTLTEARTFGWRIDDMAMLTVTLAHLLAKGGKAPFREVESILEEKFPKFRVEPTLEKFIRMGYLSEDEQGTLYVGWRTRAEIDQQTLLTLLLGKEVRGEKSPAEQGEATQSDETSQSSPPPS